MGVAEFPVEKLLVGKVGGLARVTNERRQLLGGLEQRARPEGKSVYIEHWTRC